MVGQGSGSQVRGRAALVVDEAEDKPAAASSASSSGMSSSEARKKAFAEDLSVSREEARGRAARGFVDGSVEGGGGGAVGTRVRVC